MSIAHELKTILVPKLFLQFCLTYESDLDKAIEVHDYLVSLGGPFNVTELLRGDIHEGPARMAWNLYEYYFAGADIPEWFAKSVVGIQFPEVGSLVKEEPSVESSSSFK